MNLNETDIVISGAGPVGLMCAYLAKLSGLRTMVLDKTSEPLKVGRADALSARTLQLLEVANLFQDLYPLGKTCNTSSVFANGQFTSRQSAWWDALEGTFHKHFLMLGQAYVEQLLDRKLDELSAPVRRSTEVSRVELHADGCLTTLSNGEQIKSRFVIAADGSRSPIRQKFHIPFEVTRPQIIWAVLDGVIETDFPKVPEIIVFQADTSDVAWIPREGNIDRFYVRMDTKEFELEEALAKINRALTPYTLRFKEISWFSQFSVKESVAASFSVEDRIFLAGDAAHIHSVNGGMGLNTGLADAFNLIWKLARVIRSEATPALLKTYEQERKPIALSIVETSGKLVRSTKYSSDGTHAENYVDIVKQHAGNITGMGIRYGEAGLIGTRLHDFMVNIDGNEKRIYSLLDYSRFTLLVFGNGGKQLPDIPKGVQTIRIPPGVTSNSPYFNQTIWVRPDSYIADSF